MPRILAIFVCFTLWAPVVASASEVGDFVGSYCLDCHNEDDKIGGLDMADADVDSISDNLEMWEKVTRRIRARQMPPADAERPSEEVYVKVQSELERSLDDYAKHHPNPGRTDTIRRLTRTEYANSIRDLLAIPIDAAAMLPKDNSSHGFDNVTVSDLSPTLLNRYISAAQKIARLAVGGSSAQQADTFRVRPDITQEEWIEGLPLGTRGGILIPYTFPTAGQYEVSVRLMRDRDEHVEGLTRRHELEVLLDDERVALFSVNRPKNGTEHATADTHLRTTFSAPAGAHRVGVTFIKQPTSLLETKRKPGEARFNRHRHPRQSPAVYEVSILGPVGKASNESDEKDSPSRQRIFVSYPETSEDDDSCAQEIVRHLTRLAYRRTPADEDIAIPLRFYRDAREAGGNFDTGIESALTAILVNPSFLFRVERDPSDAQPGTAYRINDFELASRLSFFLWSSIPDDELLRMAEQGKLHETESLIPQVERMLNDPRSSSLVTSFAAQWLHLRNIDSITPDLRLFPDFDHNLRVALRRETELFFESIVREDRSVIDLLSADYTFLNQRLAKHYDIPNIYGQRFRKVELDPTHHRGGLLRHGSILTVTSYANRTSPVLRGNWILGNLMGSPPPPPPDDVPALEDNTVDSQLSMRERLSVHRENEACAVCHNLMDPIGFSLENYDALGRWRNRDAGNPIDASGGLPDGSEFTGVDGLEAGLVNRPELFAGTLTEKLLTYALGRGVEHHDRPTIRKIVREAKENDYKFSQLITGIAKSVPFQMRMAQ